MILSKDLLVAMIWSIFTVCPQLAYEIQMTPGKEVSVALYDQYGNLLIDRLANLDDFGHPLPSHISNNIGCSSLSYDSNTVAGSNCGLLTNSGTFGATVVRQDNQYFPSKFTQPRFATLTPKRNNNNNNNNIKKNDIEIDDMSYFRQSDNDISNQILLRPVQFAQKQHDIIETRKNNENNQNKKKNKIKKDPNILLPNNQIKNNKHKNKNGIASDKLNTNTNRNTFERIKNIFNNNNIENGESHDNVQIKMFQINSDGSMTLNDNNSENDNENGDEISMLMDSAVSELVANMLNNNKNGNGNENVIQIYADGSVATDVEKMADEIRQIVNTKLESQGQASDVEFEFEIIYANGNDIDNDNVIDSNDESDDIDN